MELKTLIKEYLQKAKLMQLATVKDNKPWICSVWFAADENLSLYWFSSTTRRHSAEIVKNPFVAAAIVLPHTPQDPPRGLQLEGKAELLRNEGDISKAISVYTGRIFSKDKIEEFMKSSTHPHRFYRITPSRFVLFDVVNFPENSRQELRI